MSALQICTERLDLKVLTPADAPLVATYYLQNRAHLAPWEPLRDEAFFSIRHCAERLQISYESYETGWAVPFAMIDRASGAMIGGCNFSDIICGVFQACQLGYSIAATHEGKGLMFEAATAGIDYMFSEVGLHRIMANHLPENHRSAALLRRLGFEREGYAKSYLQIAGTWRDHVLNALVNPAHSARIDAA
jgi:[ribosomal protein S5]-alanine N-acetyltransferase